MSLQTPLGKVLGLGSAGEGTGHFINQRLSAVALILLGGWFTWRIFTLESFAFLEVVRFIGDPLNGLLLMLLTLTLAYHSWLGIRVVIEDYVHAPLLKTGLLITTGFVHIFLAAAALYAIVGVGLGRL